MFKFIRKRETDAHEGPVYVQHQQRLYFATKPDTPSQNPRVEIRYWDLESNEVVPWIHDARMANGMSLSCDQTCLLVCEQGDHDRPAGVARYRLANKNRENIVFSFDGLPFNSPNKVVELSDGRIFFTDPDYGRRQLFRPSKLSRKQLESEFFISPERFKNIGQPEESLKPSVYTHYRGKTERVDCSLEQPHGLALSPNQSLLYVSDTSADDGVGGFDESREHDIYRFAIDPVSAKLNSKLHIASVPKGIPDGMVCDRQGNLYCAAGDGVHMYRSTGEEVYHLQLEEGAVNLCLSEDERRLFITDDKRISLYTVE